MSSGSTADRSMRRWARFGFMCLMPLAASALMFTAASPASADTKPCESPVLRQASVHSTLNLKVDGVDWPLMTSTTQITIPVKWAGTAGLLGDERQQAGSLQCFLSLSDEGYRPAPPVISIDPKTATVKIIDTVTEADSPYAGIQNWEIGPWSVIISAGDFKASFSPKRIDPLARQGDWAVTLEAPSLSVQQMSSSPDADNGDGKLTWSSPPEHKLTTIEVTLSGGRRVRMTLAANQPPARWFSDVSWAIGDGVLLYCIASWLGWRLWRRRTDNPEQRRLAISVISISLFGIVCYVGYVVDDYFWYLSNFSSYPDGIDIVWRGEDIGLIAAAIIFFVTACGTRWLGAVLISAPAAAAAIWIIVSSAAEGLMPPGLADLVRRAVPLLLAVSLMGAGAVVWISRLWPFGKAGKRSGLHDVRDTPFSGGRIVVLVLAMLAAGVLILGQGAAGSHDVWVHRHWWGLWDGQGTSSFHWVAYDVLQETHWWIGDGLQWILFFVVTTGVFAALRALSTDSHGVFFGPSATGDLAILTAIFGAWFIGTWGYYAGYSVPVPFLVAVVGLGGCALSNRLSRLDDEARIDGRPASEVLRGNSVLVTYRKDLLAVAERAASARLHKQDSSASSFDSGADIADLSPAPINQESALAKEIFLSGEQPEGSRRRRWWQRRAPSPTPSVLTLPQKVDPGATALALGPAETWWENGIIAVRAGAMFAIIPAAFDIYTSWSTGSISPLAYAFGTMDSLSTIASIVIAWLAGLFTFGALLPYLRGARTPVKGAIFGLAAFASFAADAGLRHAFHMAPYQTFAIDGLMAVALFATVGLLLDIRTLQNHDRDQGLIASLYRLGSMRVAVTYATTLLIAGIGIWQDVYLAGQTAQQRAQTASSTAQAINNSIGAKGSSK